MGPLRAGGSFSPNGLQSFPRLSAMLAKCFVSAENLADGASQARWEPLAAVLMPAERLGPDSCFPVWMTGSVSAKRSAVSATAAAAAALTTITQQEGSRMNLCFYPPSFHPDQSQISQNASGAADDVIRKCVCRSGPVAASGGGGADLGAAVPLRPRRPLRHVAALHAAAPHERLLLLPGRCSRPAEPPPGSASIAGSTPLTLHASIDQHGGHQGAPAPHSSAANT